MKLIIAGGRDFDNYELLKREAEAIISDRQNVEIISGLARGADLLGCRFAEEKGLPLRGFKAEWGKFGRGAGIIRNKLMAKNATHLLAFWDGYSKGTMHMIDYAVKMGLIVLVVEYEKTNNS